MAQAKTNVDPARVAMRSFIQRVATGPELSKDISYEEARAAMTYILNGEVDPVQAGVFLIALRMKRETEEENKGILQAILDATDSATTVVEEVVLIADPYDGATRGLPVSAFLPAVLAACGVPAVCHGVEKVGPKYGVTTHQVLSAARIDVQLSPQRAAAAVNDPASGWAYVDQQAFCPKLHDLICLRSLIVKRPVITTVEVLATPVRGAGRTHLMTGYVHKPYPPIYAMLARHAGFASAMIVRGVEGGVIPSLQQPSKLFYFHGDGELQSMSIDPASVDIDQVARAVPIPEHLSSATDLTDELSAGLDTQALAQAAAHAGMAALAGEAGPAYDSLVYSAALCLYHLKRQPSLPAAADVVRRAIATGEPLTRFRQNLRQKKAR
jgi:anthranilate phosphoribosyltransferase